ncbi:MAG TPA: hypothetical protein VMF87_15405 [Streptosporangiaceae bacterium]|nr:hypothetical protein [Streptosporangiaceae bacterium]
MPDEPVVIRGQVRARLLGIPLLTLAARIVAESQEHPVLLIPAAGQRSRAPSDLDRPEPGAGIARARQLVRENARQLARGRGIPDY